ncbi:calcium-binding protein [Mesorhizobium sp. LHD-90]|uniref:calcium-binding protein n=1 Tax=Mesorhizobium sp. LHD-90 TaxID=3071414 RepID=UPI0027DF6BE2|nr:calcium-binding protein [Mesorhizobium sp. LHD-90]MDQ6432616.1 calcium-binding protein [Mesorhizobium sp. LHD-90]
MPTMTQFSPGNPETLFTSVTTRSNQTTFAGDSTYFSYGPGIFSVSGVHLDVVGVGLSGYYDDEEWYPFNSGTVTGYRIVTADGYPLVEISGLNQSVNDFYSLFVSGNAATLRTFIEGQAWTFNGSAAADSLTGGLSADTLNGNSGNDSLFGLAGNDDLFGDAGNDTLVGGAGADFLAGGTGTDTASYATATQGVVASFGNPSINTGDAAGDTYESVERLVGSSYNDSLFGSHATNDVISGGVGADVLKGYRGNDTLYGNNGADAFVFNSALSASTNVDTIKDFGGPDTIQLDNAYFTALTATGVLATELFKNLNVAAVDADDRILYDQDTGSLYYDSNGSGSGGRVLFAHIDNGFIMTAGDFVVI